MWNEYNHNYISCTLEDDYLFVCIASLCDGIRETSYVCVRFAVDIIECDSNPCEHGGICSDAVNGYVCACAVGYAGDNCQTSMYKYNIVMKRHDALYLRTLWDHAILTVVFMFVCHVMITVI